MITDALTATNKLSGSSTFWASILFPALKLLAGHFLGIEVPWEVILGAIGAQGVRNAAEHVSTGLAAAATTAAASGATRAGVVAQAIGGALSALGVPAFSPNPPLTGDTSPVEHN